MVARAARTSFIWEVSAEMTSTIQNVPTSWMHHGYAPRDLPASIRLVKHDDSWMLKLTKAPYWLAAICAVLAIALMTLWYVFPWKTDDIQMKWIVFVGGLVFGWSAVSSARVPRRYRKSGQRFSADTRLRRIQIETSSRQIIIPFDDV